MHTMEISNRAHLKRTASWIDDVVTATDVERGIAMATTGDHVWDAARHLRRYLEVDGDSIGLTQPGITVLELGAGCGYLGMTVARNVPTLGRMCLTEMEKGGALDHLRYNVGLNHDLLGSTVETAPCDWSLIDTAPAQSDTRGTTLESPRISRIDDEEGASTIASVQKTTVADGPTNVLDDTWSFVIGSDLVYNEDGVDMLPKVLGKLAQPNSPTVIYYCHTKHRYDMMDVDFVKGVHAQGLRLEEVFISGDPLPDPSPPPFESLFNDFRIAIWKITRPTKESL
eukprot:m.343913 g.343913  ORF g.343913 m.343913 type:complete len:284 (+) comp20638_c0_seq2:310-1161(+)